MSTDQYQFWRLIDQTNVAVNRFIMSRLWMAGFSDLRLAHSRVFENLPEQGAIVSTLAERAQMTRQSMRELVLALEGMGYVQRVPDLADRRAKMVTLTPKGQAVLGVAFAALDELRTIVERTVGQEHLRVVEHVLDHLVVTLDSAAAGDVATQPEPSLA